MRVPSGGAGRGGAGGAIRKIAHAQLVAGLSQLHTAYAARPFQIAARYSTTREHKRDVNMADLHCKQSLHRGT